MYINEPKSKEDLVQNAQFQLKNVNAWMDAAFSPNYDLALIKAKCLVEALEAVNEAIDKVAGNHQLKIEWHEND